MYKLHQHNRAVEFLLKGVRRVHSCGRRSIACNNKHQRTSFINTHSKVKLKGATSCPLHNSTSMFSTGYLSDPGNTGQRSSGINFDTLGSWNNRLELDVHLEQSIAAGKLIPRIRAEACTSATALGRRKNNEDRVSVQEIHPDLLLFAIYDGHAGTSAVDYISKHIPEHIRNWMDQGERNLGLVLHRSFNDVHTAFVRHSIHESGIDKGDAAAVDGSGCTATVCLLEHSVQLVVGHVGDSQAILCRDGTQLTLTTPHKPEKAEKARIEAAGGWVTCDSLGNPRVNGRLEMSRSLGDVSLKNYGVIADPHVTHIQVKHGKDAFLILTTDGVHYVLSPQEIVDIVCTCQHPQEAADFITDQALHYGSEDNCTTLIVPFGAWGKYAERKNVQFSFSRNFQGSRYT